MFFFTLRIFVRLVSLIVLTTAIAVTGPMHLAAFGQASSHEEISLSKLLELVEQSRGEERLNYSLAVLKRFDTPSAQRERVARQLIAEYENQDAPHVMAAAYSGLGKAYGDRTDLKKAVEYLRAAEDFARQPKNQDIKLLFKILCNQGIFQNALGHRTEAASLIREAIELAKPNEEQFEVSFAYSVLAHIAEASGAIDKAIEYFQSAFDMAVRTGKTEIAAQVGVNMIELAISERNFRLAAEVIERTESWIAQSKDPRVSIAFRLRKAELGSADGDSVTAIKEIKQLIEGVQDSSDLQTLGMLHLSLAGCYLTARDFEAAIPVAEKAAECLKPIFRSWALARIKQLKAYFGIGDATKALEGVDELLADDRLVMLNRIELLEFRSTVLASQSRFKESLESLSECRELEAKRDTQRAEELSQFIKGIYDDKNRELELATAIAREAEAETKAALNDSIAKRRTEEAQRAKVIRNGAILAALALFSLAFIYVRNSAKRKTAALIADREREMNAELKQRLADQADELEEQVRTRQQLELAVERKFRDEALGKLTGGVAHDFNNLLSVIIHSSELIRLNDPRMHEDSLKLLDAINRAAESGSCIVSQLLAYTRQQPLKPVPIKVTKWLDSNRAILQQIVGKTVNYKETDLSNGATICIDSARLTTAIINLLANARDACTSGNAVELRVSLVTLSQLQSESWNDVGPGEYCQFEVRDNGKGMSADELSHACVPFFTTKKHGSGTGLGLSTVVGFVRQSGGDFRLISKTGEGTTAILLIPTSTLDIQAEVVNESESSDNHIKHVLLVEDQEAVRNVLTMGLKRFGYAVTAVSQADEAVKVLETNGPPDVLLSDVRMPGSMNGVELRSWVMNHYPGVQVILMSGYREIDSDLEASTTFLQKPVKLQELGRVLSALSKA